jgi:predicted nucleic acid-binding protein
MILSADTNLFLYAAIPDSPHHDAARRFFEEEADGRERFLLCELVLVELYVQLRNPAVFRKPKTSKAATAFCDQLRAHPAWEIGDYES